MARFTDQTAIVTGAGNGIGKATAARLAAEGARVAVVDVDREKAEQVNRDIRAAGGTAIACAADVTRPADIEAAVAACLAAFGTIDILVNCAGAGWRSQAPFAETPAGSWEWILDLNVKGTLSFTHAVLPHMIPRRAGRIVNVGSIAGVVGIPRLAVYSASKGAVAAFTKALAMELGPAQITVNCVSPGLITPEATPPPSKGTFLGRCGMPDEVASVIAFLASDDAAFITGADYLVDGGRVLGPRGA